MPVAVWSHARRAALAAVAIALAFNAVPTFAGTTGSLTGTIVDAATSAPIADAKIAVTSPSQTAQTRSDPRGAFVFVSLAPDTYTLTIAKDGYEPLSTTGISVFADQSQTLVFRVNKSLKTIANVKTRSSLNLVRSGTITDVYSVNSAVTQAAAPIGGGANLNNAYSAIASQPGSYVPPGQVGVNQNVYIRGGYYDQVGFEYDGVPLNRSFDNYPGNPLSTMGQQELQIYAGGGGAGANATGLAGFVNQVAKTGTYPGYAAIDGSVGWPAFYHTVDFEAGGSTPDRLFSYYVGLQGYNQAIRYFDATNGAGLMDEFPYTTGPTNVTTFLPYYPAVYPTCTQNATYTNTALSKLANDPGCFAAFFPGYSEGSMLVGRQSVVNLHFGIPHKHDAGKDDVQLLYTNSAQYEQFYAGVDDAGASFVNALVKQDFIETPQWPDFYTYPSGTHFLAPANVSPIAYMFPGSPSNRCANIAYLPNSCPYNPNTGEITQPSQLPADYRPGRWDTASIMKLQYQKNFGSNAYLRAFGYIFYSYTDRSDPTHYGIGSGFAATNYEYELNAHTRGIQADFGDQINSQNLLTATYNYLTSTTWRLNNSNYDNGYDQQVSNLTNGSLCYAYATGTGLNGKTYTAGERAPIQLLRASSARQRMGSR
jgi:Carboxypeptidase regulatory-like domain